MNREITREQLDMEVFHGRINRLFPVQMTPYTDEQIEQYGNTYHILHSDSYDKMGFDKAKEEIEYYQRRTLEFLAKQGEKQ